MKRTITLVVLSLLAAPLLTVVLFGVGLFAYLSGGAGGRTVEIPEPYGNGGYTVTCYDDFDGRWAAGSGQAAVNAQWHAAGAAWTDGVATIDGRYLVACTETFGQAGDPVTFKLDDGTEIPAIIADVKSKGDPGYNQWGHADGQNVIEFEVERAAYLAHGNPGGPGWYPQWGGKRVASCTIESAQGGLPGCSPLAGASGYLALAAQIAADDSHGYTLGAEGPEEFDCQGLVKYSLAQNGYDASKWGYAPDGSGTGAAGAALVAMGFTEHAYEGQDRLIPGDILLYDYTGMATGHIAIYAGDGKIVEAIADKDGRPGDSSGQEIRVAPNWADGIWQTFYRDERVSVGDRK